MGRQVGVWARRDTVVGWLLVAVALPLMLAVGVLGLVFFPIPHGAGLAERLLHLPAFVAGSASVAVGLYGGHLLRRRRAGPETPDDR